MAADISQSQEDGSFCNARLLSNSDRESLECATLDAHAEFERLLRDRPRYVDRRREALIVVDSLTNGE